MERNMWDRYDPRCDDRDHSGWERNLGSRGGSSERDRNEYGDPRDVFIQDLDLPRGQERQPVRERDRIYDVDGTESRMLGRRRRSRRRKPQKSLTEERLERWYRYGDSNPGPVAENHVS
jgi:hypothetical protein